MKSVLLLAVKPANYAITTTNHMCLYLLINNNSNNKRKRRRKVIKETCFMFSLKELRIFVFINLTAQLFFTVSFKHSALLYHINNFIIYFMLSFNLLQINIPILRTIPLETYYLMMLSNEDHYWFVIYSHSWPLFRWKVKKFTPFAFLPSISIYLHFTSFQPC